MGKSITEAELIGILRELAADPPAWAVVLEAENAEPGTMVFQILINKE